MRAITSAQISINIDASVSLPSVKHNSSDQVRFHLPFTLKITTTSSYSPEVTIPSHDRLHDFIKLIHPTIQANINPSPLPSKMLTHFPIGILALLLTLSSATPMLEKRCTTVGNYLSLEYCQSLCHNDVTTSTTGHCILVTSPSSHYTCFTCGA
jgi:hypothetical protein